MKIISDFRDYYDSAVAYGYDDRITYVRYARTVPEPPDFNGHFIEPEHFLLSVCGQAFAGYFGTNPDGTQGFTLVQNLPQTAPDHYLRTTRTPWDEYWTPDWRNWLGNAELLLQTDWSEVHQQYETPIFSYCYLHGLIINPNLRNSGFQRIQDGATVYQAIEMYLAALADVPASPVRPLTDVEKTIRHGFDPKHSFRKPAGLPKRRKDNPL